MDLSFARFHRPSSTVSPAEWAVLLAMATARQGASRTAAVQAQLSWPVRVACPFTPADGRFSARVAEALAGWKDE